MRRFPQALAIGGMLAILLPAFVVLPVGRTGSQTALYLAWAAIFVLLAVGSVLAILKGKERLGSVTVVIAGLSVLFIVSIGLPFLVGSLLLLAAWLFTRPALRVRFLGVGLLAVVAIVQHAVATAMFLGAPCTGFTTQPAFMIAPGLGCPEPRVISAPVALLVASVLTLVGGVVAVVSYARPSSAIRVGCMLFLLGGMIVGYPSPLFLMNALAILLLGAGLIAARRQQTSSFGDPSRAPE